MRGREEGRAEAQVRDGGLGEGRGGQRRTPAASPRVLMLTSLCPQLRPGNKMVKVGVNG